MPSSLPFIIASAIALVALVAIVLVVRRSGRRRQREAEQDVAERLRQADEKIQTEAGFRGWACEMRPTTGALWYRLNGAGAHGVHWEMIEAAPSVASGEVRGPGARWSTNAVSPHQLLAEIYPRRLHEMMARAVKSRLWDPAWSAASRKLMEIGQVVAIPDEDLEREYVLVSVAPKLADRMMSVDVVQAIKELGSRSMRLSLGFPNLRIAIDEGGSTPDVLSRLARAGDVIAHRYLSADPNSDDAIAE